MVKLRETFNEIRSERGLLCYSRSIDIKKALEEGFGNQVVFKKMTSS